MASMLPRWPLATLVMVGLAANSCWAGDALVHEGVVTGPRAEVWKAFTTKAGMESWMVAHGEMELKVGGRMRTHYDPKGKLDDPNSIENTVLCLEPERMIAIKIVRPPARFPFKEAWKHTWTVIYFEDAGPMKTKVRMAMLGYTDEEESRKMRQSFDAGNAYTLRKLQEHFAKKAGQ